jgi:3-hydroxyisobutyrate dehydrogenase-like beta-hydroxyacid dehydrogenase
MTTIGVVAPGAMGTALARCLAAGGARVVTTLAGRSAATVRRAEAAGLADAGTPADLAVAADVVLSVVPPGAARRVGEEIAAALRATGARPLVAELNAVAPATVAAIAARMPVALVDGAISGPPPSPAAPVHTRVFLSGDRAAELAALPVPGVRWVDLRREVGAASAAKTGTASVRKGFQALLAQAVVTAEHHGVLDVVLDDLRIDFPDAGVRPAAVAATKAWRFADEMAEIAATQDGAGVGAELFTALAGVYARLATSRWGRTDPGDLPPDPDPAGLRPTPDPERP